MLWYLFLACLATAVFAGLYIKRLRPWFLISGCIGILVALVLMTLPHQLITAAQTDKNQDRKTQTAPSRANSGQQKIFKPKTMADGKLKDDVRFHRGTWIGPDDRDVSVLTATFGSSEEATKWLNERIRGALKVSERKPISNPKDGPIVGERILAVLAGKSRDEPETVLFWTDGPVLREIHSLSSENVLLAEKVFFPHYYALSHGKEQAD